MDVSALDEVEKRLRDKRRLKGVVADPASSLEQSAVEPTKPAKRGEEKRERERVGKGENPPSGAAANPTTGSRFYALDNASLQLVDLCRLARRGARSAQSGAAPRRLR